MVATRTVLDLLVNELVQRAYYALIALGLTSGFETLGIVNFAHGGVRKHR